MTTFQDGPAAASTLQLRRAPKFLRVVVDGDEVDALDQLEDSPRATEKLFAYVIVENHGMIHINARDKRGRRCGGYYAMAKYALVEVQPADEIMRSKSKWRNWCEINNTPMKGT